jgi:hypothetical protein
LIDGWQESTRGGAEFDIGLLDGLGHPGDVR